MGGENRPGSGLTGTVKAGFFYFASVFGVGFVLGTIRVPFLVPRLGARCAELLELPIILVACYVLARFTMRRFGPFADAHRVAIGAIALTLLIIAELGLALVIQDQSLAQFLASRDPVSGAAYALSLVLFALMPRMVDPR